METTALDNFDKQVKELENITINKKKYCKKYGKIKKQVLKKFDQLPKKENQKNAQINKRIYKNT